LYDSLNDDDDEIRDLSAKTASLLLKKSLLPLIASEELAAFINLHYKDNALYASNVVCRLTGNNTLEAFKFDPEDLSLRSAAFQFTTALEEDDSLFVEEEQNLFVDEIRELKIWSKFIGANLYYVLECWVQEGLHTLNDLLSKQDGPLGWTSKPVVFSICMRILVSAKALQRQSLPKNESIIVALKEFERLGREAQCHESLLFEVFDT